MEPVPPPDRAAEPEGFVVVVEPGDRIHFLDWGGGVRSGRRRAGGPAHPRPLQHGLVVDARSRAGCEALRHVVAMDLRGHGLSDAPTEGYDAGDLRRRRPRGRRGLGTAGGRRTTGSSSPATGSGRSSRPGRQRRWASAVPGSCSSMAAGSRSRPPAGMDVDEFLRGLDEPPEVMRSMTAFLADREAFDPATWDADQEQAARATVVETHAGKVVPSTRPHALEASVRAMFRYDPLTTLAAVTAPVAALVAGVRRDGVAGGGAGCGLGGPGGVRAEPDPGGVVRPRRAQPDALPSGGGQRGDPVDRRRDRPLAGQGSDAGRLFAGPPRARHLGRDLHGLADPGQRGRRAGRADPRWRSRPTAGSRSSGRPSTAMDPITAVHDPGLVRFLEVAWSEHRAQGIDRPFLTADTYPNRSMFEGMSAEAVVAARPRAGPRSRDGPGSGASIPPRRWSPARTSPRAPRSTSR